MRILSWNINGVRTLPQYHPWNTLKTTEAMLDELQADVICFQEMKITRKALTPQTAVPGKYDAFFSFPLHKGGYSGVAVYTNSDTVTPVKAEEGLTGTVQPKPALSVEERISPAYPSLSEETFSTRMIPDEKGDPPILAELDLEGRAICVDFGLFVLINVYCPADSADTRNDYKMNFGFLLQERVRLMVEQGREVIVVGDLNACVGPIDHAEGKLIKEENEFYAEREHRMWLRDWVKPRGAMHDVVREHWPERRGMFTCWNTKIQARETNYGARIDYILVSSGLVPWIKFADIQPAIKGSDHCPVILDLHDSIQNAEGETVLLKDAMMKQRVQPLGPPRICARLWDEFSAKQTLLSTFFGKRGSDTNLSTQPLPPTVTSSQTKTLPVPIQCPPPPSPPTIESDPKPVASFAKRKIAEQPLPPKKKVKDDNGQSKLSSFFVKPPKDTADRKGTNVVEDVIEIDFDNDVVDADEEQFQRDIEIATRLSQSQTTTPHSPSSSREGGNSKAVWSSLLAPLDPPKCSVHQEGAKLFTVNKPGPNKGKTFYICSRPVGPGYDSGKGSRARGDVNDEYRCNYFVWAADVARSQREKRRK